MFKLIIKYNFYFHILKLIFNDVLGFGFRQILILTPKRVPVALRKNNAY